MPSPRWPRQDEFDDAIYSASRRFGVRVPIIKGIIATESGFNPAVIGPTGDYGLMQMIEPTARSLGYLGPMAGLLSDPVLAIELGTRLLAENLRRSPAVSDSVSAYNGGWRTWAGYGARLPTGMYANQSYVTRVLENISYFEQWEAGKGGTATSVASFPSVADRSGDSVVRPSTSTPPVVAPKTKAMLHWVAALGALAWAGFVALWFSCRGG